MPVNLPPVNGFGETAGCKANGFSVKTAPKADGELNNDEIGFLSMIVQMANDGTVSLPPGLDGGVISDMLSGLNSMGRNTISGKKMLDLFRLLKQEGATTKIADGDSSFDFKKPTADEMPVSVLKTAVGDVMGKDEGLKIVLANPTESEMSEEDGQMKLAQETPILKNVAPETMPDRDVRVQRPIDSAIMDQIGRAFVRNNSGRSEIRLSLHPPELGHLRMSISTQNNHLTVKIIVEAPMVKDIIDNNLDQLRADLGNRGLEIANFDVSVSQDHTQNGRDLDASVFAETDHGWDDETGMPDSMPSKRSIVGKIGNDNGRIDYFV